MRSNGEAALRRRTWKSCLLLLAFMGASTGLWFYLNAQTPVGEVPKTFRTALELNGKIWQSFYHSSRLVHTGRPPAGKIPRVNGDIGLSDDIDINSWRLEVISNDHDPKSPHHYLTMKELLALPRTQTSTQLRCVEGWSENMDFAGIKFADFIKAFNLPLLPYVGLQTEDGKYYVSLDIESMMHEQTLLAYEMNGAPLRTENGAPLRLVIPTKYGIKNIKRISKIFMSPTRPPDYWAEKGYDWYAGL
jgi:hypothetical protein